MVIKTLDFREEYKLFIFRINLYYDQVYGVDFTEIPLFENIFMGTLNTRKSFLYGRYFAVCESDTWDYIDIDRIESVKEVVKNQREKKTRYTIDKLEEEFKVALLQIQQQDKKAFDLGCKK